MIDPGTRREVVIPGHDERRITDTQVNVPPLTAMGQAGPCTSRAATVRPPSCARPPEPAVLDTVGMAEINKIFVVLDAIGVHREHVVIPLGTGKGRVRRMPSGKLEIIVDAEIPIDEWLKGLPAMIQEAQAR